MMIEEYEEPPYRISIEDLKLLERTIWHNRIIVYEAKIERIERKPLTKTGKIKISRLEKKIVKLGLKLKKAALKVKVKND